jgi:hypothetical protein
MSDELLLCYQCAFIGALCMLPVGILAGMWIGEKIRNQMNQKP